MAGKSGSGITGSHVLVLAGILLLGAASYSMLFKPERDQQATPAVQEEPAAPVETATPDGSAASEPETAMAEAPDPLSEQPGTGPAEAGDAIEGNTGEEAVAESATEQPSSRDAAPTAPSFDLVRVDPEGAAVIAGNAPEGAAVRILSGDSVLAETVADETGKFVALFDLPPSQEPRSLAIEADGADGAVVASTGTVLIAATAAPEVPEATPTRPEVTVAGEASEGPAPGAPVEPQQSEQLALAEPSSAATDAVATAQVEAPEIVVVTPQSPAENAGDEPHTASAATIAAANENAPQDSLTETAAVAANGANVGAADVPETELASAPEAPAAPEPAPEPATPAIVLADETGVRVLQPAPQPLVPGDNLVSTVTNLVIDTITYNTEGEVALGGRGAPQSFARIYVNDRAVQTVEIDGDGSWAAPLPDIDAGVYRLRIDEVAADGTVTSRVETPFQREEPAVAALVAQRPNAVVVEEGFTLWAIAEDSFGSGFEYVRVYEANRDLIRDPDLIYPGQVFRIPEALQSDDG